MSGSSLSIIDSLSPASVSSVHRNFLDYSVVQGRVQRPIEMLTMDVRPYVKKCTPHCEHLQLILGRCVVGILSVGGYRFCKLWTGFALAKGLCFTLHLLRTVRIDFGKAPSLRKVLALGFNRWIVTGVLVQALALVVVNTGAQQAMIAPSLDRAR